MKKLSFAIGLTLVLGLSSQSHAGFSTSDMVNQFSNAAQKGGDLLKKICSKGSLLSANFTIRAGNGEACRIPEVAVFAELFCPDSGADGYMESQCHSKAEQALANPAEANSRINKLPNVAKQMLCQAVNHKASAGNVVRNYLTPVCH